MTNEMNPGLSISLDFDSWSYAPLTLDGYAPSRVEGFALSATNTGSVVDTLARMDGKTMLNQIALANALGVSTRTVRRLVVRNEIPPGVTLGARRVWLVADVLTHIQRRAEKAAKEAERTARRIEAHCNS